jgi:PiT family inorganic phosphate transporter
MPNMHLERTRQTRTRSATTIAIASGTGIPISTTHTLVGAVLGVGLARGIEAIDLRVVRRIFISWFVTIPAGACLAIIFFFLFRFVLP